MNVAEPEINTAYFRLNAADFIEQHADDTGKRGLHAVVFKQRVAT